VTGYKIGSITQYYEQLGVAIVDLTHELHLGDWVRISGSTDFTQQIESIQVEHEQVSSAQIGDTVGLKLTHAVVPGDELVKIEL